MPINKEIITRLLFGFLFLGTTLVILIPVFWDFLKNKISGNRQENDIDGMIRRQKQRLSAQYGGPADHSEKALPTTASPKEVQKIYQETKWGGGQFLKDIQSMIAKNYSIKLADSKINAFLLLCEKRRYIDLLDDELKTDSTSLINFLATLLLIFVMLDELKEKKFYIIDKVAKKLEISPTVLSLALQIKLLLLISSKDEQTFSESIILNHFSEETIKKALETIIKREANLWAKDQALFFEELTLAISYASIIVPMPKLKNKKDIETALQILGVAKDFSMEEIKRTFKKIALTKHPDKITSQALPAYLEKKAIAQFTIIQEAYVIITESKNKD